MSTILGIDALLRSLAGERHVTDINLGFRDVLAGRYRVCLSGDFIRWALSISFPLFSMAIAKESHATQSSTKPVKVFRFRGISASIFENHAKNDGRDSTFHKVSLQRSYRDGEEWKTSTSFNRDDLPLARLLLEQAWQFILETEATRSRDEAED